jgi:hypothetical protein
MKTKTINIYEVHQRWMQWHCSNADYTKHDTETGEIIEAIYRSPLYKWGRYISPGGTIQVPDMDYYNALTDPAEMKALLDELKPS